MKPTTSLVLAMSLLASACAPVATSVPKMNPSSTRTVDSLLTKNCGRIGVVGSVAVRSAEKAESYVKSLKAAGYTIDQEIEENSSEFSGLRELKSVNEIKLSPSIVCADIVVGFLVKKNAKGVSESLPTDLKIDWNRNEKNEVSFTVSMDGASAEAWSKVKAGLVSVVVASREAKN